MFQPCKSKHPLLSLIRLGHGRPLSFSFSFFFFLGGGGGVGDVLFKQPAFGGSAWFSKNATHHGPGVSKAATDASTAAPLPASNAKRVGLLGPVLRCVCAVCS